MTKALSAREKFQQLLRELFQFDCADLDFGIYRIMNHKRAVIEKFISEDLLDLVGEELKEGALAEQAAAATQLPTVVREVGEILGYEAMDADGNLRTDYAKTPLGQRYLAVRERSRRGLGREEVEAELFNHLFSFFSRYYQDGDFIPRRLYAAGDRYVIPYDGSEVTFHWANRDQYYVKSSERFHDYAFVSAGVRVRFALRSAHLDHGDVKGAPRFFVPVADAMERDENSSPPVLEIPFDYRPLTGTEAGERNGAGAQEAILDRAVSEITAALDAAPSFLAAITVEYPHSPAEDSVTALRHHLRQYTRRNTSDFFIHKDLDGFLTRELDSYLKNEVVRIEDLEASGVNGVLRWLHKVRVLKVAAERVIKFLSQLESFQKMLWEKRKFVTDTQYCIAVGQIPETFHGEIAAVDDQWREWDELFGIDSGKADLFGADGGCVERRLRCLQDHPTMLLDTRHFDIEFADRLVASFGDLDGTTDGVLVHGDNFQTLTLLGERYRSLVECLYIDPPYNTGDSEILYRNGYLHSSWMTLMENRISAAGPWLSDSGILFIAIDDFEMAHLCELIDHSTKYGREMIVVNHHPQGGKARTLATTHEYMLVCFGRAGGRPLQARAEAKGEERRPFKRSGTAESNFRKWRPNSFYAVLVDPGTNTVMGVEPPPARDDESYDRGATPEGYRRVFPLGARNEERVWRRAFESGRELAAAGRLTCTGNGTIYQRIETEDRSAAVFSNWTDRRYNAGTFGANLLGDILGRHNPFSYPKSVHTVSDAIHAAGVRPGKWCLDYFAGSGTTGHAVIELNREDGGGRKFILAEVGEHFDSVVLPRMKKIAFAPEWKEGRPKRMATEEEAARGPRVIKYLRLESYEDALDNITFDEAAGRQALGLKDYLLEYMLKWETKRSGTRLNVEQLASPFRYGLRSHRNGDRGEKRADVAETFNYLLGLEVETRRVHHDDDRRYLVYAGTLEGRRVSVIWRDTVDWGEREMARDAAFVAKKGLADGAEEVFMNSPTLVRKAKAIEPLFKERMFAPVGP